jgi:hypothetical protein
MALRPEKASKPRHSLCHIRSNTKSHCNSHIHSSPVITRTSLGNFEKAPKRDPSVNTSPRDATTLEL